MLFLIAVLLFSFSFAQDSFRDFLKEEFKGYREEKRGFEEYLREVNREFEEYKRIVSEEFREYKKEILKYWDRAELSDRKKLVQYSEDLKVKRVFDFEKGELRIEVRGRHSDPERFFKRELKSFISQDTKEAFESDRLLRGIETRVGRLKHVRKAQVKREPLLQPILLGRRSVSPWELNRAVDRLIKRGRITTKRTKKGIVQELRIKLPPKRVLAKARQYKPVVKRESSRWELSPPLVFAIIHTESYFNPLAVSPVPAYGLMQIVPQTAGKDATTLLFGRPQILSPSFLFNAENNIKVGTAYLYLLYYKYFRDVRDPESRLYCTIAAYNTGPGNVARAFTGTRNLKRAVKIINSLTPREVYSTLLRNLPYEETKDYLRKVSLRIAVYKNL